MVRHRIAVHLSGVRHKNHQTVILRGKLRKQIQEIGKILRFRLPRCGGMLKTVDRVEDEDAASPTQDKLTGFGKHPFRSGAAFEGDVTDVFGKKLFRTEQKSFRHAATVLKTASGQFLDQLAEMVDDRIILRTEKRYLPLMAHTEAQHQFVQPFRFSGPRYARNDDQPPTFVRTNLIHLLPARLRSGTEAVVEQCPQVFVQIGGGEDAFKRDFFRLLDGDAKAVDPIFDKMFIGILAPRSVDGHTAAFGTQTVDQFVTQFKPGRVGVNGYDDVFQILEVRLHEAVEPRKVRVSSGRYGDHAFESGGKGGRGIQFAFVDDAGVLSQHGIDIVGNQFGSLHHFEIFGTAAEFGVDEFPVLKIVETDAPLFRAGLRHELFLLRDAQTGDDGLRNATRLYQPTFRSFGKRRLRSVEHRTVEMLGNGRCRTTFTGSLSLGFRTLFGIVGDVEVGSAMVAMAMSCVDIDPQRTVTLVVPRREALLANGFNDTAGMSADIDMIISKISHISCFYSSLSKRRF